MNAAPQAPDAGSVETPPPSLRLKLTYAWRLVRVWLALRLVRGIDGTVVARSAYLAGVQQLAELDGFLERSGLLRHRTHAAQKVSEKSQAAHQSFVNAVALMDPKTTLREMRDRYVGQRIRSLSKNQQRRPEYRAALSRFQELTRRPA